MIYKTMDIGSGKPDKDTLSIAPHRLIDILDPKESYSAALFCEDASFHLEKIFAKGKIPILVGGTGLYFKALVDGLAKISDIPIPLREKIRKYHKKIGQEKFYNELLKLDPKAKKFVVESDNQRSIRAYEVKKFTKKSLYDWIKNTKPTFDPKLFKKFFIPVSYTHLTLPTNREV